MIDVHCHILPGIDDGPSNMDRSLSMARLAVLNGITHSIMTPHLHPGRYENQRSVIQSVFDDFKLRLKEEKIPLKVGMAAEVRIDPMILRMVEQGQVPFIGRYQGYDVLLLELPHSHVPPGADKFVQWMLDRNILPMIAHPERNKDIMRNYDKLQAFFEAGCLMQVTASSIAGGFGEEAFSVARRLLEEGKVTLMASDAHNTKHRPPELFPGMEAAAEIIGKSEAASLVFDVPLSIASCQFSNTEVDYIL